MELGLRAIERQQITPLIREKAQSRGGEQSAAYYQQLGQMTGAQAFIAGSIGKGRHGGASNMTVRLIDAKSGDIIRLADFACADWDDAFKVGQRACRGLITGKGE